MMREMDVRAPEAPLLHVASSPAAIAAAAAAAAAATAPPAPSTATSASTGTSTNAGTGTAVGAVAAGGPGTPAASPNASTTLLLNNSSTTPAAAAAAAASEALLAKSTAAAAAAAGKKGRKESKTPLKEKFVQIYEAFFNGDNPSTASPHFWDELFLLKVNAVFLDRCITSLSEEQLMSLKDITNLIVCSAISALRDDNAIRVANALQTLCIVARAVSTKKFTGLSFDPIQLLVPSEDASAIFTDLFASIASVLSSTLSTQVKAMALKLLIVFATFSEGINSNSILEHIMRNDLFDAILQTLVETSTRELLAQDSLTLIVIFVNYRKYEVPNPYVKRLSEVHDELVLNALGSVMSTMYASYNRYFDNTTNPAKSSKGGFLSSITSWFGSTTTSPTTKSWNPETPCPVLLTLYEAIHLNRNFFSVMCYLDPMLTTDLAVMIAQAKDAKASPTANPAAAAPTSAPAATTATSTVVPSNLLSRFMTFCSFVFQAIKDEPSIENARLCVLILQCVSEDAYSNAFLHDPSTNIPVSLYRRPTRHKRPLPNVGISGTGRPLVCSVFDLMIEFMGGNLKRNLSIDLYCKCVGIIHRLLCYEKRSRVRLAYTWKETWTSLVNVLRFVRSNETTLIDKHNVFLLYDQIVSVFNLFITYGDTFLANPTNYDELYYEIMRVHEVFHALYEDAKRHYTSEGEWRDTARRVMANIVNILSIINHFSPKIEAWTAENQVASVTPEQVLAVIKNNYDTLTLKLQDNLDQYDKYAENPREVSFFRTAVRHLVVDTRHHHATTHFDPQEASI
ncbi:hypothetical protein CAOG_04545 [Capsaspora owczarzaki ATCC 30864]|uniref:Armadillo-like helical domain-containing protein n=1 Tax=Capsaspora owczarzaki (strain ATCC 30864) TaxID=595528 RepID=A0A0D2VS19_CAPO3|nr:hypothetical protein CAOG_04545 [Capsaspora owczarzaki ATCC 30864]KJE93802.1 hypothetical protein CAOG_004545 [Capsaspora owczarzaki ATCC 30864]|eukprot:XP_004347292.1 hypothetical protein CAOG_04545 [Capsaspora owczarzaki ATCC 30864]